MALRRVFLIDGTAFCYRAFYAIRQLSTSDGRPTNAVYGFTTMLNALRKTQQPDYLAVAFDVGKPTFRHERYASYKSHRKPMPEALIAQLPLVKEVLAASRVPVFEREGFEAEDVLATIARRLAAEEVEVFLVTGDKDALQLVGPHIKVYNPHHDATVIDEQAVRQRFGVPPARIVDWMALTGDETDNIPGVPGIGPKTASELLQQFDSVEALYGRLHDVESQACRKALQTHRQQVELARELARIKADVPIDVNPEDLKVQEPDWPALKRLFRRLEFKRLAAEIDAMMTDSPLPAIRVHLVQDAQALAQLAPHLASTAPAAVAVWTGHATASATPQLMVAIAWTSEEAWLVPLDEPRAREWTAVTAWLSAADRPKIGHDLKTAMRLLRTIGRELEGITADTMIAAYLLTPSQANPSLREVAEDYLERRLADVPSITPPDADGHAAELFALPEATQQIMAQQVTALLALSGTLETALRKVSLDSLYRDVELPLVRVLADMEHAGIAVDQAWLSAMRQRMAATAARLTDELYALAGRSFNLQSPKQLAEVLFTTLKLPVVKRTKTGPSTDAEVLQKLAEAHPFPNKLLEYRELTKLISTYLDALPVLINPRTGRIHTIFHQTGTATGRLSSSNPNLQNIPIKTELGRQIRKAFIPSQPQWELVAADYSQIELRVLAHLCGDPELTSAFRQERDIHRHTASLVYGVPEPEVTSQMRQAMKAINYGIVYGMSAHGLAKELGLPHEEAATFIEAYFARYPRVRAFLDAQIQQAAQHGYVQTLLGRRRYIPELTSPDPMVRQFGERMAINAPVQGTAADLIKRAMIHLAAALRQRGLTARVLLQVHDELVCETSPKERDDLVALLRDVMEHAVELSVPLRVGIKCGPNWLEMVEVTS